MNQNSIVFISLVYPDSLTRFDLAHSFHSEIQRVKLATVQYIYCYYTKSTVLVCRFTLPLKLCWFSCNNCFITFRNLEGYLTKITIQYHNSIIRSKKLYN